MEQHNDLSIYLDVLKRRRWHFLLPALVVMLVSATVAMLLPSIFIAEATIQVEAQEIPENMVQSTVTGYVEERLQAVNQVVLSRSNLLNLIERYDLYPEKKGVIAQDELANRFRESITLEPVRTEVFNPRSGQRGAATIAFKLSCEGKDPQAVAKVVSTLASQLIEENSRQREFQTETTVTFLEAQLEQLNTELAATEAKIAEFKDQHLRSLPDLMTLNLQSLQRMQELIDRKREHINNLEDRRIYLQGQLALIEPEQFKFDVHGRRVMSPKERLAVLQSEYFSAKASRSAHHPDVISLKKQIEALEGELTPEDRFEHVRQELQVLQNELVALQEKYSSVHPDVIKTRKRIEDLKKQSDELARNRSSQQAEETSASNPAYIELRTRLKSTELDLTNARKDLADALQRYEAFQERIEQSPKVEQQYTILQRDYMNLKDEYQETKARLMQARESQNLEQKNFSQKLRVINPPAIPEKPSKPNRVALLFVGAFMATGFGMGAGTLAEFLDRSVHTVKELASKTSQPILAAIPYLETRQDRRKRLLNRLLLMAFLGAALAAALWGLHVFVMPLEMLWVTIVQQWGVLF